MNKINRRICLGICCGLLLLGADAGADIDYGPWLTGVTQNGVTVKWASGEGNGLVEYGETESLGLDADTAYHDGIHRADLSGLATGTRYFYRVSSGGSVSSIQSFLTAPEPDAPFRFGVVSDTQGDPSFYLANVENLLPFAPAFVLHNGDSVSNPLENDEWVNFWSVTDLLAGQAPYFPVKGNHDFKLGGSWRFKTYWTNPLNEETFSASTYSFQYGNTFFISLDVNRLFIGGSSQYRWLKEQLREAKRRPSVKHCLVHAHFPPFSTSNHGSDFIVLWFRQALVPLFEQYDIDLYMSGHDHTYQHSEVNGIPYLVTGCSSSNIYDCGEPAAWTVLCEKTQNFAVISIDGYQIQIEARRPDNSLIETFTIDHDFHSDDDDDNNDDNDNDNNNDDLIPDDDDDDDDDNNDNDSDDDDASPSDDDNNDNNDNDDDDEDDAAVDDEDDERDAACCAD